MSTDNCEQTQHRTDVGSSGWIIKKSHVGSTLEEVVLDESLSVARGSHRDSELLEHIETENIPPTETVKFDE